MINAIYMVYLIKRRMKGNIAKNRFMFYYCIACIVLESYLACYVRITSKDIRLSNYSLHFISLITAVFTINEKNVTIVNSAHNGTYCILMHLNAFLRPIPRFLYVEVKTLLYKNIVDKDIKYI